MQDLQTVVTSVMITLSVTLASLPVYDMEKEQMVPIKNYRLPKNAIPDNNWGEFSITPLSLQETLNTEYKILTEFATNLIEKTIDLPPEFSNVLVDDFWDLI